jgi:hypothetical protein
MEKKGAIPLYFDPQSIGEFAIRPLPPVVE